MIKPCLRLLVGVSGVLIAASATAATQPRLVKDVAPGASGSDVTGFVTYFAHAGKLLFAANDGVHGAAAWVSDGTESGTVMLADVREGDAGNNDGVDCFVETPAFVLFKSDRALWRTDGTPAGTSLVKTIGLWGVCEEHFAAVGNRVVFRSTIGSQLYVTDGTEQGTVDLKPSSPQINVVGLTSFGSKALFFESGTSAHLWATDGTTVGTAIVTDVPSVIGFGDKRALFGGAMLFSGNGQLWRTDGTSGGTTPLKNTGDIYSITPVSDWAFVNVDFNPWRTDGTTAGTNYLKVLRSSSAEGVGLGAFVALHGVAFFAADDGTSGNEIWMSKGVGDDPAMVKDIAAGSASASPSEFTVAGDNVYFAADDGAHGRELWRSDGTDAGTELVADIAPGNVGSTPTKLTVVGNRLFFEADDGEHGRELWAMEVDLPDAGVPGDGGSGPDGSGGDGGPEGGNGDASSAPDASHGNGPSSNPGPRTNTADTGCGCRMASTGNSETALATALAFIAALGMVGSRARSRRR